MDNATSKTDILTTIIPKLKRLHRESFAVKKTHWSDN